MFFSLLQCVLHDLYSYTRRRDSNDIITQTKRFSGRRFVRRVTLILCILDSAVLFNTYPRTITTDSARVYTCIAACTVPCRRIVYIFIIYLYNTPRFMLVLFFVYYSILLTYIIGPFARARSGKCGQDEDHGGVVSDHRCILCPCCGVVVFGRVRECVLFASVRLR